jgi:hypothetical protein
VRSCGVRTKHAWRRKSALMEGIEERLVVAYCMAVFLP